VVKKVLFIYTDTYGKNEISGCENIFRALFRKFRVSPVFRYLPIDTSPSCTEKAREILLKELPLYDAVFLCPSKGRDTDKEIFEVASAEHHICGKAICFPVTHISFTENGGCITKNITLSSENADAAVSGAYSLAAKRQRRITVCLPSEDKLTNMLSEKSELYLPNDIHISREHMTPDEMMLLCAGSIPSFDVILTTQEIEKLISLHLSALKSVPYGYIVYQTFIGRVYTAQSMPFDGIGNSVFISALMAFSALIENELDMKSASEWLRRSIALTSEAFAMASRSEFTDRVIYEINKPMRNTKRADK